MNGVGSAVWYPSKTRMSTYCIPGHPELGLFTISPSLPAGMMASDLLPLDVPAQETRSIDLDSLGRMQLTVKPVVFKKSYWAQRSAGAKPKNGVLKPHPHDWFWPAYRARLMVKACEASEIGQANKEYDWNMPKKRMSYNWNMRVIAFTLLGISPEELRMTNPIVIGRKFGLSDDTLRSMINKKDYEKLAAGWSNPYYNDID